MNDADRDAVLAASLTAESTDLLPFLPYLLQDLWELGGSPQMTADLLGRHLPAGPLAALDLACGKGAVAVRLAQRLGWRVTGVDLIPEFVEEARRKAEEHGVGALCTFECGDANAAAAGKRGFDCVLFAAAGNVLGAPPVMLEKLAATVRPGGWVLLDESYLPGEGAEVRYQNYEMLTLPAWQRLFAATGLTEVERLEVDGDEVADGNQSDMDNIQRRAAELTARHPEKRALFEGYVRSQLDEVHDVENSLVNAVWLLQKE